MAKSRARKLADIIVGAGIDIEGNLTFDGGSTSADLTFADNDKANFGDASDLQIYHDSSHSYIQDAGSGNLYLRTNGTAVVIDDGTNNLAAFNVSSGEAALYYGGSGKKVATTSTGVTVTGQLTASTNLIATTATYSPIVYGGSSNLQLKSNTSEMFAQFVNNGAAELYYDNSKKLETTSTGVSVTGDVDIPDGNYLDLGSGGLTLRTNANNAYITESTSGKLAIQGQNIELANTAGTETFAYFSVDGAATLYYDNSAKLATTSTGVDITGTVTADGLTFGTNHRVQGTGGLFIGGSTATVFEVGAGSEEMRLTSTGLGIGTQSPGNPLEIQHSTVGTGNGSNNTLALRYNSTTLYGQHYMDANGIYHILADNSGVAGGNLQLDADTTLRFATGSTPSERMRIDSSGNVGIGTTSPDEKLHISGGGIKIDGDVTMASNEGAGLFLGYSSNVGRITALDQGVAWKNLQLNSASILFYIASGYAGQFDASSNLLLGGATANDSSSSMAGQTPDLYVPGYTSLGGLRIKGTDTGNTLYKTGGAFGLTLGDTNMITLSNSDSTARLNSGNWEVLSGGQLRAYRGGNSAYAALFMDTGENLFIRNSWGMKDLVFDRDGNLGIGTSDPDGTLHVHSGSAGTITAAASANNLVVENNGPVGLSLLFDDAASNAYGNIYWGNETDGSADGRITYFGSTYVTAADRQSMEFRTAGTARMRIDSSGNLLVGKTSANFTVDGHEIRQSSYAGFTRDGGLPLLVNRRTSSGDMIEFYKDSTSIGTIGSIGGANLFINSKGSGGYGRLQANGTDIGVWWSNGFYPGTDASYDLGVNTTSGRWRNLYLSGNAYLNNGYVTSLLGANDTNTYINFAGSDQTRFYQGGTERARFDGEGLRLATGSAIVRDYRTLYNGSAAANTVQYIKLYDRDSTTAGSENLHFYMRGFNHSEYSVEVKIFIPTYSGFTTSYGTMDAGQGIEAEIICGGLSSQGNVFQEIIEVANLSSTTDNTEIWLKTQVPHATTGISISEAADSTDTLIPTGDGSGWTTTAPSNQHRVFPIKIGKTINGIHTTRDSKLGVGTSTPAVGLHVYNAAQGRVAIENASRRFDLTVDSDGLGFRDQTAAVTKMTLSSANPYLFLGHAGHSWGTFHTVAQIGRTGAVANYDGGANQQTIIANNTYYGGSGYTSIEANSGASYMNLNQGHVSFFTAPATTAGSLQTFTKRVQIQRDGNVGIGEDSPAGPLHVTSVGNPSYFEGTGGNVSLQLLRSDASGAVDFGDIQFANSTGIAARINSRGEGGSASGNLTFQTRNTSGTLAERMRIQSGGKVGIGGTVMDGQKLNIEGWVQSDTRTPANAWLVGRGTGGDGLAIGTAASSPYATWFQSGYLPTMGTSNHYALSFNPHGGNVGIGQVSPAETLHIGNGESNYIRIHNAASGDVASGLTITRGNSTGFALYDNPADDTTTFNAIGNMNFRTDNSSYRLYISDIGRVGINTNSLGADGLTIGTASNGNCELDLNNTSTDGTRWRFNSSSNGHLYVQNKTDTRDVLLFGSDGTLRTVSSDGTAPAIGGGCVSVWGRSNSSSVGILRVYKTGDDGQIVDFYRTGNSLVGSISIDASGTAYNTTSDRRLKKNIENADDAGQIIDGIQVRKFDWIEEDIHQRYGMIAQELNTVAPEAVYVPEDEEKMQSVDYSKLVPMLVKEIQSLRARVAELEGDK